MVRVGASTLITCPRNNYNATLTLSTDKKAWVVDEIETLPEGTQPQITVEELIECDELVRQDGECDLASSLRNDG